MNKFRFQVIYIQNNQRVMDIIKGDDDLEVRHYLKIYRGVVNTDIIDIKCLGKGC